MRASASRAAPPASKDGMSPIIVHPDVKRMLLTMRALTGAARAISYATAVAIDRAHRSADEKARDGGERARLAADADRQGVRDRCRLRGLLARRAGAWRHGLYRGDRRGAALPRRAHRGDLRRHQRHPGDRSRHPQAADVGRRRRASLYRRAAAHRRCGEGRQRSGLRRDRRAARGRDRQPRAGDRMAAQGPAERGGPGRRHALSPAVRQCGRRRAARRAGAGRGAHGGRRFRPGAHRAGAIFCGEYCGRGRRA